MRNTIRDSRPLRREARVMRTNPRTQFERAKSLVARYAGSPAVGVAIPWLDLKLALDCEAMRRQGRGHCELAAEYSTLAHEASRAARQCLPYRLTMPRRVDPLGIVPWLTDYSASMGNP